MRTSKTLEELNIIEKNTRKLIDKKNSKKNEYQITLNKLREEYYKYENEVFKLEILYLLEFIKRILINGSVNYLVNLKEEINSLKDETNLLYEDIRFVIDNIDLLSNNVDELFKVVANTTYYEDSIKNKIFVNKIKHSEYVLNDNDDSIKFINENKKYLKK